jgi:UDP-N-acetylglucosamine acyltransferase
MDIYEPYSMYDVSNEIAPEAIIYPNVKLGKNNRIGPYAVIGSPGEIRDSAGKTFEGWVIIGDNNVISELVTIQAPLEKCKVTKVGSDNIIMAHSHIGHDAEVGDNCELGTGTIIGGYARIGNDAKLKLRVTIRNRKVVGEGATVGMGSVVVKDVKPGETVVGVPAKPFK